MSFFFDWYLWGILGALGLAIVLLDGDARELISPPGAVTILVFAIVGPLMVFIFTIVVFWRLAAWINGKRQ
jgi:hypothetical protein